LDNIPVRVSRNRAELTHDWVLTRENLCDRMLARRNVNAWRRRAEAAWTSMVKTGLWSVSVARADRGVGRPWEPDHRRVSVMVGDICRLCAKFLSEDGGPFMHTSVNGRAAVSVALHEC